MQRAIRLFFALMLANSVAYAAEDRSSVRIGGVIYLGDLPTVVAEHEQLFERYALKADIEYDQSGKANLDRLRAGEIDYALMALTPIVIDQLADATPGEPDDPVILASLVHSSYLNQVIAHAGRGIETPADLRSRRIGLNKGTKAEFVWWLFAHFHGLDPAAAELIDMPVADIDSALVNGDIDAAVTWEPWVSRLQQHLGEDLLLFPGGNIYTAKWVIVTSRRNVSNRAGEIRAILSAYRDAIEFIERHPDLVINIYATRFDTRTAVLRHNWQTLDYDLNLDWSLIASLQQQFDWARLVGYPATAGQTDILSLLQPEPLRSILPSTVGISTATTGGTE